MLTSILEPGVFLIGTKTFKAGDALPLNETETKEFEVVCGLYDRWVEYRTKLLNAVHQAKEPYVPTLANEAHDMKLVNLEMRYRLNILIATIEKRLGGLLPVFFNSAQKILTVANRPDESVIYTTKFIGDTLGMPAFEFPKAIASVITNPSCVFFDYHRDDLVGLISVFAKMKAIAKTAAMMQCVVKAIVEATKKEGPSAMSLLIFWYEDEIRIVNADAAPTTTDPSSRPVFKVKDVLTETKPAAFTLVTEKAEQNKITFSISHIQKGKPPEGRDVIIETTPVKKDAEVKEAKPNFAPTRMPVEVIDGLLG